MRVIIPPMGNETITMLKSTGLVVVIGGSKDLFTTTQNIYTSNGKIYPLLVVASLWYLLLTSLLSVGQFFLERRFGRGSATSRLPGPLSRMFGGGGRPDPVGDADPPTQAPVAPEVTGR
jgi:polar amino acid transport system permease protein